MTSINPDEIVIHLWDSRELWHGSFGFHQPRGVSIRHIPTGIIVKVDEERSQHKNKEIALRKLALALEQDANKDKL